MRTVQKRNRELFRALSRERRGPCQQLANAALGDLARRLAVKDVSNSRRTLP